MDRKSRKSELVASFRWGVFMGMGVAVSGALLGCGDSAPSEPQVVPPIPPSAAAELPATANEADATAPMHDQLPIDSEMANDEVAAVFAKMSPEDRVLAEKQKICPVSGEPLGSMGAPPKVTVAGHEVFVCCAPCADALQKEPEKYFAKIGLEPGAPPVQP